MNILLVSECDKRALVQTRRILDQFAERRGERTWQTPITQEGLDTLRRLLRASARKNTAVACHWIRGQDHTELLWVVGDKTRFNAQGAVPTHTTRRDVLRAGDENDWHSGEDIHLLAALAALLHDLGKASAAFQSRLQDSLAGHGAHSGRNRYRHEWVSLRLFQAFVGQDEDAAWLARLADPTPTDVASWVDAKTGRLQRDGLDAPDACVPPFQALAHAPLAQAVGWLILTHHRLPVLPAHQDNGEQAWLGCPSSRFGAASLQAGLRQVQADWNEIVRAGGASEIQPYWHFPQGLPVALPHWQAQAKRLALRLQAMLVARRQGSPSPRPSPPKGEGEMPSKPLSPCGRGVGERGSAWLDEPYVMHLSRLALMLADHHYSSLNREDGHRARGRVDVPEGCTLLANTYKDKVQGRTWPNQTLDEHLIGVAQGSRRITHALPSLTRSLPGLVNHKPLRKRSTEARFAWQNKAADAAASQHAQAAEHGAFIVNMASTGTGKTLANARVMNALADPERGLRCAFAMGLRTLTLQTGRAFQTLLSLGEEQLAIRVGGHASRALFEHFETRAEATGSASNQALLLEEEEEGSVEFAGDAGLDERHPVLARTLHDPLVKKLLVAPVLVCTIDHLTPATESQRGGRQIAPMLRLLSGDLVLDEPDDFDLADLPALTRLVHWAGLLGSRVLLSSATLAPALVQGLFLAYRAGRMAYQRHRGARPSGAVTPPEIACLWLDEFNQQASACATPEAFQQQHEGFAAKRHARLAQEAATPRRRCALVDVRPLASAKTDAERASALAVLLQTQALALHELHAQPDPQKPERRVSFGLIRMANIEPLVQVARALFALAPPPGVQIHLCVYHSQFPLLLRSNIERRLDAALNRRDPEAVFALADIRTRLEAHPQAAQHLFIVLGSPVTEVGRDHDYDWAIVEPSSMRSLIQLVGRVKRHRVEVCGKAANVRVLDSNWRHFSKPGGPVFYRPGFETSTAQLVHRQLRHLLRPEEFGVVDARPRIVCPTPLEPHKQWVDLEHWRMAQAMLPPQTQVNSPVPAAEAAWWWWHFPPASALMTALLPQHQPFRDDTQKRVDLCLRPTDDDPERIELTEVVDLKKGSGKRYVSAQSRCKVWTDESIFSAPGICAWAEPSYDRALAELAQAMDMPLQRCAERFGTVSLPASEPGWWWHAALGFVRR